MISLVRRSHRMRSVLPRCKRSFLPKVDLQKCLFSAVVDKKDDNKVPDSVSSAPKKQGMEIGKMLKGAWVGTVEVVRNPKQTWISIKEVAQHYWLGSKLLWAEIKIAKDIMKRSLSGSMITRRERNHLIRTTQDLLRLVPFAVFVIVPFMEFLLPFALKLFPNMLPSTFQDSLKKEETMKKELQMRLALAGFLNETLREMASNKKRQSSMDEGALDVLEFIEKARIGEPLPNETVIRIARLFKDEMTLANIARPQLVSMCQYMNLAPYGSDSILRFQLKHKFRNIRRDDRRILWDGIDSMTIEELREACQERGMRSVGLSHFGYKRQLQEWIDLSIQKSVPIALLIMSRAFTLSSPADVLKNSLSSLTDDTINEVVLSVAKPDEEKVLAIQKRKLESLQFQKELIDEEREIAAASANKKKAAAAAAAATAAAATTTATTTAVTTPAVAAGTTSAPSPSVASPSATETREVPLSTPESSATLATPQVISTATASADTTPFVGTGDEAQFAQEVAATVSTVTSVAHVVGSTASVTTSPVTASGTDKSVASPEIVSTPAASTPASPSSSSSTAGVTPTSTAPISSGSKDLTVDEMEALGDLARSSYLEREKAELSTIQAQLEAQSQLSLEEEQKLEMEGGSMKKGDKKEAKSVAKMRSMLSSMVGKLEAQMSTTEKALGQKLSLLDKDDDGELSTEELKEAMSKLLKRAGTEVSPEEIVKMIDQDQDGKISVAELLKFVESKKENQEVEGRTESKK